jgi:phosphoenolpyruvate-protein phosphotransferase
MASTSKKNEAKLKLIAPMSGAVIPLERVPDPVFAEKMVGDGIAIDPTSQFVFAPCSGKIVQLHPALHAITIAHESGAQVLLHIGLDTVKLKGEGFKAKVRTGDNVTQGQLLIEFDADLIAQKAKSLISLILITEAPKHDLQFLAKGLVTAKGDLFEIDYSGSAKTETKAASKPKSGSKPDEPRSDKVRIALPTGLHARPAAQMVSVAKQFSANITIHKNSQSANAKSVVGLLGLEVGHGDEVYFTAAGADDAQAAVEELALFLRDLDDHAPPATASIQAPVRTASSSANVIGGIAASPGLAIGRIHQIRSEQFKFDEKGSSPAAEKEKLNRALRQAIEELNELRDQVKSKTDAQQAAIFTAHQELLEDPDLIELTTASIDKGKSAAFSWNEATNTHAHRLSNLNNELMANRANDLRDVGRRVLRLLTGASVPKQTELKHGAILIAENLTPSDTVQIDREKVLGFCTTTGGATSHVAILARSLGLPAIAGIDTRAMEIAEGTEVVLDGDRGELRLNPTADEKKKIQEQQLSHAEKRKTALSNSSQPARTKDGHLIEVGANIGGVADAREAVEMGCDGVGLLRSEFLFLERTTAPTEDEQYRVYQEIADVLGDRPLTIRTLDVGGDKPLQYLPIPPEENPFLGVRGLRVGFLMPEILREQLRAILRVRSKGTLNVMFPMVAMIEEFRQAKAMLEEERAKLGAPAVKIGIMIEVPSAALMAETFAPEVDFFSIGTNDLTQYTLAMDRGHKDLAKLVDSLHPSVLRLIEITVQAAHRHKKWVGVCGGIASDPKAVPILLGLGVDELSVSLPVIPMVKSQVREATLSDTQVIAKKALASASAKDVRGLTSAEI